MGGNGTERKTGQAIKSEVLFRKGKQKTVSFGHLKEKEKKEKQATSLYWLPAHSWSRRREREGGDNGSQHTGNFKRHCLETRNEEKASMRHDYLRTGLAR